MDAKKISKNKRASKSKKNPRKSRWSVSGTNKAKIGRRGSSPQTKKNED